MKKVQLGKYIEYCPTRFSEITTDQLLAIGYVVFKQWPKQIAQAYLAKTWLPYTFAYNEKLYKISNHVKKVSRKKGYVGHSTVENEDVNAECVANRHYLLQLTSWFDGEHSSFKWLLPSIRIGLVFKSKFVGPSDKFTNIQFWQWCMAQHYFSDFQKTANQDSFLKFLSCLYLKPGEVFEESKIKQRSKRFKRISPEVALAIQINYVAVKAWLAETFKHLFSKPDGESLGEEPDYAALLFSSAELQYLDDDVVAKKPLLSELKKLDMRSQRHMESQTPKE